MPHLISRKATLLGALWRWKAHLAASVNNLQTAPGGLQEFCFSFSGCQAVHSDRFWNRSRAKTEQPTRYVPVPKGDVHKKKEVVQDPGASTSSSGTWNPISQSLNVNSSLHCVNIRRHADS